MPTSRLGQRVGPRHAEQAAVLFDDITFVDLALAFGFRKVGSARTKPRTPEQSRLATMAAVMPPIECPSRIGVSSLSAPINPTTSFA